MFAIETENLHKSYDGIPVLRGLDMRVPTGQVYGILGPNGTGKSTLIHLLLGFLKPSRGSLRVLGESDLEKVRGRIGYLPERLRYHLRFSGREYLRYLGQFSDMPAPQLRARVDEELRAVGLADAADRQLSTYSKGMLQRLGIAQSLMTRPDILLIDEPTSGLDPAGQHEMLALLAELRGRGHTILLTTHFLEEAEQLCDQVGVLFGGKLATEVDVSLLRAPGSGALINVGALAPELVQRLQNLSPAVRCNGREITLQPNTPALQAEVLRMLLDSGTPIIGMEAHGRPLEDIYLRIVRGDEVHVPAEPTLSSSPSAPPGTREDAPRSDRPVNGDKLLRELLGRDVEPEHPNDQENGA